MAVDAIKLSYEMRLGDGVAAIEEPELSKYNRYIAVASELIGIEAPDVSRGHSRRSNNKAGNWPQ